MAGLCGVDKLPFARETADVERFPPGGNTCLCAAVVRGDDSIVTMLLHWGASVNALGKKEQSPLVIAARAGMWQGLFGADGDVLACLGGGTLWTWRCVCWCGMC